MSWRTSLLGAIAGLAFVSAALVQEGPWTTPRILSLVAGALVAALGAVAKDAPPPPAAPGAP